MNNTVGILSLQGDFREHREILTVLGVPCTEVRLPRDLENVERLIIPGGESTTIGKLLKEYKLLQPIRKRIKKGMPVWGTCAGAILLAKRIEGGARDQTTLGVIDITARRNAFGRQLDSFETKLSVPQVAPRPLSAVFIRAPFFEKPGATVAVLARLPEGGIVAAQQRSMLITAFHTELSDTTAFHKYFLSL